MNKDLEKLIENLPFFLQHTLHSHPQKEQLVEIIFDLGRRPEARFVTCSEYLSPKIVSWQDIDYITKRVSKFSSENRAGIDRTLNRISCLRNRQFLIYGLTCRVGRAIFGSISAIRDLLETKKSILILGKPGSGKTTIIREIARVLANEMKKRVIIIDTSNEIAGDSDIPHTGIGKARRMQVSKTELQHQVMMEAVENHMPQVIMIDEIGTELEVLAARTIAEKGVQLVGTTHGNCLENVIKNPPLADLIGGIQYVTLSDEEAKKRNTQKSILERKTYPTFDIVIEINQPNYWTIHEDVKHYIDLLLRHQTLVNQNRYLVPAEKIQITSKHIENFSSKLTQTFDDSRSIIPTHWYLVNQDKDEKFLSFQSKTFIIYPYSLSVNLMKEVLLELGFQFRVTNEIQKATFILGFQKNIRQNKKLMKLANQNNIPIYTVQKISFYELSKLLKFLDS